MKITNNFNLPEPIHRAVSRVYPPVDGRISVSHLIGPPLIRHLTKLYWDELEEDASDRLWALLGQGLHYVLEQHTRGDFLAEERLQAEILGITIAGRADLYWNKTVADYKVVSAFSFLLGPHVEWERQLNTYAFLYRHIGFQVNKLQVNAILRDWVRSKALREFNYPKIPFQQINVPVWSEEEAARYVIDRVRLHKMHPSDPCTDADRWRRETTYAVKKKGAKRALIGGVKSTLKEAEEFASGYCKKNKIDLSKVEIEERPGEFTRCKDFCVVRNFCDLNPYKNQIFSEEEEEGEAA
jgi:hypothetical protein